MQKPAAAELAPQSRTIPDLVSEMARRYPDREAIVGSGERLTYRDLDKAVTQVASFLLEQGVRKGDKIGVLMGNLPQWIVADFAITSIGAVMVGVNTWVTARELGYVLEHSDTRLLITTGRFLRNDYRAMISELRSEGRLPLLENVLAVGADPQPGEWRWSDAQRDPDPAALARLNVARSAVMPDDPAYILYTSGSTALPKGVVVQHRGLIENMWEIGQRQHVTHNDRLWLAVSLFWGLGCENALFNLFTHGGCIVLQESFDPEVALELIEREQCTMFYGTPNMAEALLSTPGYRRERFKSMRGGATIGTPDQIRRLVDEGLTEICNIYGLTETYGNCSVTDASDDLELRLGSIGKPLDGFDIRVVDCATEQECAQGDIGEIRVKGHVLKEYYKDPERTREVFDSRGYFRTGDLGLFGPTGHLFFRGRIKEMIKTGGMNVSPVEVEQVLTSHPGVMAAYCVPLPDPELEEVFGAVLVPKPGAVIELEAVQATCAKALARYKRPRHLMLVDERDLPLTITGKVKKDDLIRRFNESGML